MYVNNNNIIIMSHQQRPVMRVFTIWWWRAPSRLRLCRRRRTLKTKAGADVAFNAPYLHTPGQPSCKFQVVVGGQGALVASSRHNDSLLPQRVVHAQNWPAPSLLPCCFACRFLISCVVLDDCSCCIKCLRCSLIAGLLLADVHRLPAFISRC